MKDVGKKEEDIEKVSERADEFKDKMKAAGEAVETGMKAAGAAMVAAGTYSLKFESEYDQALNTLATSTGAAADKIDGLDKAMAAVYENNYGEDIQEVGEAMGVIVQQTGEMDPSKLQEMAESAFTLRDTFDMDVGESMRAVNQLMTQFGLSSEEAFDLVAQGAQNGLNKNDNLLDSINEYGPKFAQMGLSASDMFNMFKNGAEAGVFDIDKLGDAVNEFSIRVKDGTADNAFKELGMDVDATKKAFGEGGEAAKKAMQDTFEALGKVSDPLEQNTIGVELFGTMWEDTGGQAILAMGNMEGAASDAAGTMEKIKEMRYDDLASEFQGLGRSIQTELIKPLGEELGPVAKETIDTVKENLPQAKEILKEVLTDITEFHIPAGKIYLSPIIDCFDGMVVSWTIGTSPNSKLANTMLQKAIEQLDPSEHPLVHSDRGCHYRWPEWINLMDTAGLTRSMSKKGCSPDNSACEGFFGRLKNEMFYGRNWNHASIDSFIHKLDEYIHWYNETRIKISLGGMSPFQYRRSLGIAI